MLGLCAFKQGLVKESQSIMQEMFATQKVKELLAQGMSKGGYLGMTPEQERIEWNRQTPFHMHLNLDLLECVYLVSSMLLEIPQIAFEGEDSEGRRKVISRTFRRLLDYSEKQPFTGPPERERERVLAAAKSIEKGEWKQAVEMVKGMGVWRLLGAEQEKVKEMLERKIKEESLRTYLFRHSASFSSISLLFLSQSFDLQLQTVTSLVSKMIFIDSFPGSLDSISGVVVIHRVEQSKVQQLALLLAEKVNAMTDQNEKHLDSKLGSIGESNREGRREEGGEDGQRRERRNKGGYRGDRGDRGRFNQGLGRAIR